MSFLGRNPFASILDVPVAGGALPRPGCWAKLQGRLGEQKILGNLEIASNSMTKLQKQEQQ